MSAADTSHVPRKVWTRTEVDRLSSVGLSLELVTGDLIDRMGKKPPHTFWKSVLQEWLVNQFGFDHVRAEDPIDVAPEDNLTSEPEPDLAVTAPSRRELRSTKVKPGDLRLVVEISDTTYDFDRTVKASLYARAAIREYWIIDIRDETAPRLIVHLDPKDGRYQSSAFSYDEDVTVLAGLVLRLQNLM